MYTCIALYTAYYPLSNNTAMHHKCAILMFYALEGPAHHKSHVMMMCLHSLHQVLEHTPCHSLVVVVVAPGGIALTPLRLLLPSAPAAALLLALVVVVLVLQQN